jgi:hypothetical protein
MPPRLSRRITRPVGAPPPLQARVAQSLRDALRPYPSWETIVPDAGLRAYFAYVRAELGEGTLRYFLGDFPPALAAVNISAYLPTQPLLNLEANHYRFGEDESRAVVVRPATIRGILIERLIAVLAVLLAHDTDTLVGDFLYRLAAAAANGASTPFTKHDDDQYRLESDQLDPAWQRMFGTTEWQLRAEFQRALPQLAAAENRARPDWRRLATEQHGRAPTIAEEHTIAIAHGFQPSEGLPYHFLNWAWAEHRQLSPDYFIPYGLDDNHREFLLSPSQ